MYLSFVANGGSSMRILTAVAAVALSAGVAVAQKPANPDANTPAVSSPNTKNPNAPVEGANSFTEGQARSRIEARGYTDVSGLKQDAKGVWRGRAKRNGKQVNVSLDFQGNVTPWIKNIIEEHKMTVTISRLYNSHAEARAVVQALESAGVKHGDISILASNADGWYPKDGKTNLIPDRDLDGKDDRKEAAGVGAGIGAAAGGTAGLLAGLGLMAIPGVGPVVAAGWLVAALTGAAAGGATGGVIGALTQAGVSKEEADVYAESIRRGGALVSARVNDADASRLQSIMDRSSVDPSARASMYRKAGWQRFDPAASPYTADQVRRERELYR
jgi:hypothetical protein